jgi:glycerol-3-phosphate acyltransferase PlsY
MVSVGSIAAVITVPIFTAVFYGGSLTYIIFAILLAVVAVLAHHKNIRRIAKGEEPRFSVGKKNTAKRK